ncbi:hypothetical protein [Streptomyces sp. NPDC001492]
MPLGDGRVVGMVSAIAGARDVRVGRMHVDDPVAFVRAEATDVFDRLLTHLTEEARRITVRLRDAGRGPGSPRRRT